MRKFTYVFLATIVSASLFFTSPINAQEAVDEAILEATSSNSCEEEQVNNTDENVSNNLCEDPEADALVESEEEPEIIDEGQNNIPKGEVSQETVAGTEEEVITDTGAVLSASTENTTVPAVLAETGVSTIVSLLVGVALTLMPFLISKRY